MKKQHFAAALILMIFMLAIFPAHGETVSMNVSGVPNLTLSVDPTGKAEGFSAIVYNNPNGLPTSEANAIAETSEGFIWIGSYAGLIRYDNGEIMAFTPEDGLFSDWIRTVSECEDGRILVANTGGVSIIDGDRVVGGYGEDDGIAATEILTLAEGFNGDIILGSDGGGTTENIDNIHKAQNEQSKAQSERKETDKPQHS